MQRNVVRAGKADRVNQYVITQMLKQTALSGMTIGLYFSAHWCPPCRGFTPHLVNFYNEFKKTDKGKDFEIIFVSSDRDQGAFDEYFKEMPWLSLPYSDRKTQAQLSKKFKVQGIPMLVLVDSNGKIITSDGRSEVGADPKGTRFPWTPKPLFETIGGRFIDKDAKEYTMNDIQSKNVIGFYFSAHWCGPCQMFTPTLVKFYNQLKEEGKSFEIVFVSSDEGQAAFNEYFSEMPWKALPFGDPRERLLKQQFGVRGIPSLIIVDNTGKILSSQGRTLVEEDPTGFPWPPKASIPLGKSCIDVLHSRPCVLFFPQESKYDEQYALFQEIAEEYFKKFDEKSKDDTHPLAFLYDNNKKDPIVSKICQAFYLGDARPLLCITDVPSQTKFVYTGPITATGIREFIENYLAEKLTSSSLGE